MSLDYLSADLTRMARAVHTGLNCIKLLKKVAIQGRLTSKELELGENFVVDFTRPPPAGIKPAQFFIKNYGELPLLRSFAQPSALELKTEEIIKEVYEKYKKDKVRTTWLDRLLRR